MTNPHPLSPSGSPGLSSQDGVLLEVWFYVLALFDAAVNLKTIHQKIDLSESGDVLFSIFGMTFRMLDSGLARGLSAVKREIESLGIDPDPYLMRLLAMADVLLDPRVGEWLEEESGFIDESLLRILGEAKLHRVVDGKFSFDVDEVFQALKRV